MAIVKPDGVAWQELVRAAKLDDRSPEEIVAVCRRLDPVKDERLLGQLMSHLSVLATRFLAPRVCNNLPNGGKDALTNVRSRMFTAILDPDAADGLGYEMAFYGKLQQRLVDEIRREAKRRQRFEPRWAHAAATTSRHVCIAEARKARCVLADVRWRWTLKVLWTAACTERNLCADPALLKPCILRSRRRVG